MLSAFLNKDSHTPDCLHPGVPPADVIDWARVSEIGNQIYRREGKTHG